MRHRSGFDFGINTSLHIARWQSSITRRVYSLMLPLCAPRRINQTARINAVIYSFSSEKDVPEQTVSIRSFIKNVGQPAKFIVISDGTHSNRSRAILCSINPCVQMIDWQQFTTPDLPQSVINYTKLSPMGKKLAVLLSIPATCPTIYADSDIVFFAAAKELIEIIEAPSQEPKYLKDCKPTFDDRLLTTLEYTDPVNAGFFLFKQPLDWRIAVDRLEHLRDKPVHFTEQTLVHLVMHANGGLPLDASKYIIQRDDEYISQDMYVGNDIVLRHYASPVRYKLWQQKQ